MIFISGVHGVGKSYFCHMVKDATGIESYSASTLISQKKLSGFSANKLIPDIDDNQKYLLQAVNELKAVGQNFMCGITFERHGTIGRGSDKCDFYFYMD